MLQLTELNHCCISCRQLILVNVLYSMYMLCCVVQLSECYCVFDVFIFMCCVDRLSAGFVETLFIFVGD